MKFTNILLLICFAPTLVFAQGEAESVKEFLNKQKQEEIAEAPIPQAPKQSEIEKSLEEAKAELEDQATLKRKLELANKMHQVRPTRTQVDSAVDRAALNLPARDQKPFRQAMRSILNYNAIERISIDAMVSTYTLKELETMVEYYSKPEAISASRKIGFWATEVQPEIRRMIDRAMIRIRTGQ